MSRHSKIDDQLAALYAHVPQMGSCDGRCAALVCRPPVEMSTREAQRTPIGAGPACAHLAGDRCSVYEGRPMLCRLWGVTETLPCPFGCQPDSPRLTAEQEFALFVYSLAAGGGSLAGWPETFNPERAMDAYRADLNGIRTRFLAGRARARKDLTSLAVLDRRGPGRRPATGAP